MMMMMMINRCGFVSVVECEEKGRPLHRDIDRVTKIDYYYFLREF